MNQWDLDAELFKKTPVLIPPTAEQCRLASLLDDKTAQIDAVVEKTKAQIEKLQEYRAALIYNAVTGKINVQEYVH